MVAGVFILLIKRRKRMTLNIDQESCIKCGKCVRVCPSDIFTQERAGETIAGTCRKLHRLRALRGRMSDGLRVAQRIPAGENAYDRLQPNAYAGAGDVADQSRRSNRTLTSRPVPRRCWTRSWRPLILRRRRQTPKAFRSPSSPIRKSYGR